MIEQLTKHQLSVLIRLANSQIKVYCAPAGVKSDKKCDEITQDFNAILRLVELGLMSDVSDWPKYEPMVKKYREEDGREVAIVNLNVVGGLMFKRAKHERWTN